jgi:phospholipid/cholesterol/gamma-HCH transport system ATP-binding protein
MNKTFVPGISISKISKSFGDHKVLDNISFEIEANKTTAILGPSGTGKSVLLKLITGLLKADSGKIIINDINVCKCGNKDLKSIREVVGMLFQNAALFDSLTLLENVKFPLERRKQLPSAQINEEAEHYLNEVGLSKYANYLPGQVSIGMRKRVGIARAMIIKPKVLLFDEPNTGLDPIVGQEIYDLINELRSNHSFTGIIVSHEIPEVFQCCSKVVMLYNGSVHFDGSVEDFLVNDNPIVNQFTLGSTEGPIQISV